MFPRPLLFSGARPARSSFPEDLCRLPRASRRSAHCSSLCRRAGTSSPSPTWLPVHTGFCCASARRLVDLRSHLSRQQSTCPEEKTSEESHCEHMDRYPWSHRLHLRAPFLLASAPVETISNSPGRQPSNGRCVPEYVPRARLESLPRWLEVTDAIHSECEWSRCHDGWLLRAPIRSVPKCARKYPVDR